MQKSSAVVRCLGRTEYLFLSTAVLVGISVVGQVRAQVSEAQLQAGSTVTLAQPTAQEALLYDLSDAAPPVGGASVRVNQDPGNNAQNETSIDLNPVFPDNLVAGANDYRGTDTACGFYASFDQGQTWPGDGTLPYVDADNDTIADFAAAGDPALAFDGGGRGYYLCMNFNRNFSQHTQYVFKSFDGGENWGPPVLAAGTPLGNFDDKGHLAVDTWPGSPYADNVYMSFTRINTGEIRFNRSIDGANSFEGCLAPPCADQVINDGNPGVVQGSNIAVAPDGVVWIAWADSDNAATSRIMLDRSDDGGVTFGTDLVIHSFEAIDNPHVSKNGVRPLARVNSFPVIKVDPSNANIIYAVWAEDPTPGAAGATDDDSDIMFKRCTYDDGLGTLSCAAAKRINDDVNPPGDFHSQFFPWMAIDPIDGSINIVWYDDRNDPDRTDGTPLVDLYFASSANGGNSFSQNLRVSEASSDVTVNFGTPFFGDYNGIVAFDGVAYPFWTDSSGSAPGSNANQEDTYITQIGGADLRLIKTGPASAGAGETMTYGINVTNDGPAAAFNVVVEDTLPVGVTYVADTDSCTEAPIGTLTCELGGLGIGDSASFDVQVTVDPDIAEGTVLENTATTSSDQEDLDTANNSDTVSTIVNTAADLVITKTCKPDEPAMAGGEAFCEIVIVNNGPATARNVTLSDDNVSEGTFTASADVSEGACFVDADQDVDCSIGDMAAGENVKVTVTVSSDDGVDINDVASVTSDTPDPDPANNSATGSVSFVAKADLAIAKNDTPDPVNIGEQLTYDLTVTNNGPSTAVNVVVEDILPAGVVIDSVSSSAGTCNAGEPGDVSRPTVCTFDSIASGANETMQIVVTVPASVGPTLINDAQVSSDTQDPNNANDLATTQTTVEGADIWIDKTGNFPTGNPSGTILYYLTVHNEAGCSEDDPQVCGTGGPEDAANIMVIDRLPSTSKKLVVEFVSEQCSYDEAAHQVSCMEPVLPSGSSVTFEIQVRAKGNLGNITNVVDVSTSTFDPNTDNNRDELLMTVQGGTGDTGGPGGGRGKGPKPK
jgi:uncharacterized repeat protein (TIGR01451 family)